MKVKPAKFAFSRKINFLEVKLKGKLSKSTQKPAVVVRENLKSKYKRIRSHF